jgi:hypothetical protein
MNVCAIVTWMRDQLFGTEAMAFIGNRMYCAQTASYAMHKVGTRMYDFILSFLSS